MNNYIFGGNLNANMSKSFNSFSKNKDRSHTPLLRAGENKGITLGVKVNKNRYVSKSPNLGKGSIFKEEWNYYANKTGFYKEICQNYPRGC